MTTNADSCPTHTIIDDPTTTDAFETHDKLAEAIAATIESGEGGRTITLEGPWGSGKSTVVKILREKLRHRDTSTSVLEFDAWAHQGDPLRRTFLESVICHLLDEDWLRNPKVWRQQLHRLQRRRRTTKTTSEPNVGIIGMLFALALTLIPIGAVLVATGVQAVVVDDTPRFVHQRNLLWIGSVLMAIPISMFLLRALLRGSTNKDLLPLLLNTSAATTTNQTLETPDPTSLEFTRMFSKSLNAALSGKGTDSRQLVVVVDNLDRVDPDDARKIWSTLQAYLADTRQIQEETRSRLWILLPFAREGVDRLFTRDDEPALVEPDAPPHRARAYSATSESYIEKYSLLRFDVPPPVMSDWKSYLSDLFAQALPEHASDDHLIFRIFSDVFTRSGDVITPRRIKRYVNGIGVMHRTRGHDLPVTHLAMYVSLKRASDLVIDQLNKRVLDQYRFIPEDEVEDYRRGVAAAALGIAPEKADQTILQPEIMRAMASGDSTRLREMSKMPGFWSVLERFGLSEYDPPELGQIASACVDAELHVDPTGTAEFGMFRRTLIERAMLAQGWKIDNSEDGRQVAAIARATGDTNLLNHIVAAAFGQSMDSTASGRVEGVQELKRELDSDSSAALKDLAVRITGTSESMIEFATGVKRELGGELPFDINMQSADVAALMDGVAALPPDLAGDSAALAVTETYGRLVGDEHLNMLLDRASDRMNDESSSVETISTALDLFDALGALSDEPGRRLAQLATAGPILHHYHTAATREDFTASSRLASIYLKFDRTVGPSEVWGDATEGAANLTRVLSNPGSLPDEARELVDFMFEHDLARLAFRVGKYADYRPFVQLIVDYKVQTGEADADTVVENWPQIADELPNLEDQASLVAGYNQEGALEATVRATMTNLERPDLLTRLVDSTDASNEFDQWLIGRMTKIDETIWKVAFTQSEDLPRLIHALHEKGHTLNFGLKYQQALFEKIRQLADDPIMDDSIAENIDSLVAALMVDHKLKLSDRLAQLMVDKQGDFSESFLLLVGPLVDDRLYDQPRIVEHLLEPIIDRGIEHQVRWLVSVAPRVLDRQQPYVVSTFRDKVENSAQNHDAVEDAREEHALITLAKALGIKTASPTEE